MKRRGFSLAEVLVVMGLLALLVGLAAHAYVRGFQVQQKAEKRSDTYRNAVLVMNYLETALRGARIESAAADRLQFRVPLTQDGKLLVDASGSPQFGDTMMVERQADGVLWEQNVLVPNQRRVIARLGSDSGIHFTLNPDKTLFIALELEDPQDRAGKHRAVMELYLGNQ